MTLEQAVAHGLKLARIISPDPDAESAAAIAAWKAHEGYDASRGVPLDRWLSLCVRRAVRAWEKPRRGTGETKPAGWWMTCPDRDADRLDDAAWSPEWELLCRHYVDKESRSSLAERQSTTVYELNKRISAAVSRLS